MLLWKSGCLQASIRDGFLSLFLIDEAMSMKNILSVPTQSVDINLLIRCTAMYECYVHYKNIENTFHAFSYTPVVFLCTPFGVRFIS